MPYFTNVSLGAWHSKSFFVCLFVKILDYQSKIFTLQFVASVNMLWASITLLDMIVSQALREQNVSNNKDKGL